MTASTVIAASAALVIALGVLAGLTARGQLSPRRFALLATGAVTAVASGLMLAGDRHG